MALSLWCDFASLAVGSRFCWCWLTWEQWSLFYSTFSSHRWVQLTRRLSESLVWSMMWIVYCCSLVWRDYLFWYVIVTEWTALNECVPTAAVFRDCVFLCCPCEPSARVWVTVSKTMPLPRSRFIIVTPLCATLTLSLIVVAEFACKILQRRRLDQWNETCKRLEVTLIFVSYHAICASLCAVQFFVLLLGKTLTCNM